MKLQALGLNLQTLLQVPLAAGTITVLFAVAALPAMLLAPVPGLVAESPAAPSESLALARTGQGTWILNGMTLAPAMLARVLSAPPPSVVALRFQPSESLSAAQVADSLAWLKRHSGLPVRFEAMPVAR
ncbi:MAG: hypothetical protein VKI39_05400 [Synechococcus sp.]|nr:hypothetical protein [Synechococcus sp.]